jgi:hypothetical protein
MVKLLAIYFSEVWTIGSRSPEPFSLKKDFEVAAKYALAISSFPIFT